MIMRLVIYAVLFLLIGWPIFKFARKQWRKVDKREEQDKINQQINQEIEKETRRL